MREVDELVFLDIAATPSGRGPDFDTVDQLADECFMPMAVGGGVRTVDDVSRLLHVGADKVVINTAAIETPDLVSEVSRRFGAQCVVVSIDARRHGPGDYEVLTHCGRRPTGLTPAEAARSAAAHGAGEIIVTAIERDGMMSGYDIDLCRLVSDAVDIPVIASGGAGGYHHMAEVLADGGASAVAAASIFHFTEQTPLEAKRFLHARGFHVRL
jgi:cyclase